MTDETIKESTDCPSAEDLCAWFDGQLASTVIDAHVDACAKCKSIVSSYTRIDRQIKENVERPTQRDMGILVRIKDGSMKEISRSEGGSWFTPAFIAKIALSCVVIGALLATIFMLPKRRGGETPKRRKLIETPPTVQVMNPSDQAMLKLARKHSPAFKTVDVLALGTNPEILEPIDEKATPESLRADVVCTWSSKDPTNPLRFFKSLLPEKFHEPFDEKILESSDYCTVVLILPSGEARTQLDDLLKSIGCEYSNDSSVTKTVPDQPKVRYSFILAK